MVSDFAGEQFAAFYNVYRANLLCYRHYVPRPLSRGCVAGQYRRGSPWMRCALRCIAAALLATTERERDRDADDEEEEGKDEVCRRPSMPGGVLQRRINRLP